MRTDMLPTTVSLFSVRHSSVTPTTIYIPSVAHRSVSGCPDYYSGPI
jgi:spore maturation protein SpmA